MRVAIVGSGIAGLAAAHALLRDRGAATTNVIMFEASPRAGGHVYTVDADGHAIDMGFIVCNRERYPQFCALLDELGIATRPTTMSFSVVHGSLEWGSESVGAVFAQRRRLVDPRHWRFLARVVRFLSRAKRDLSMTDRDLSMTDRDRAMMTGRDRAMMTDRDRAMMTDRDRAMMTDRDRAMMTGRDRAIMTGRDRAMMTGRDLATNTSRAVTRDLVNRASLDEYLSTRGVADELRDRFVVPLAAALWSLAPDRCGAFPAVTFLRFLDQHGMLSIARPLRWHTIGGGSWRYVDALLARLHATHRFQLRLATPVTRIDRDQAGVSINGERFDRVIIATHADTALRLLAEPTSDERRLLGAFRYSTNRTVLHTDRSFLPRAAAAHAAWNYVADRDTSRVAVTYSMTRLQGLPPAPSGAPYLVTLNPRREPRGILHDIEFAHPQLDRAALDAQVQLPVLAGTLGTYYAGAHFGFGFHEDGMRSGLDAAARLIADAAANLERAKAS